MTQAAHSRESIEQYLGDWVVKEGLSDDIEPGRSLMDIGFDSLSIVDLARSLKRDLGITVPPTKLLETATVADTAEVIANHAAIPGV